jgi:hypothetical protein
LPALRIPSKHRDALLALARLSDASASELTAVLEKAAPKLRTYAFAAFVADKVASIPGAESKGIVAALIEMALVRATTEVPMEMFVQDVNEALSDNAKEKLSDEEQDTLRKRLAVLLSIPSVALPAKGRSLLIDHAHYMCEARIFTDVRPVFGSDVKQSPATALIVHTLKMTYHRGRAETQDFFVVLDSNNLDELSELIERARAKEKSLQAVLASAGLEPLD